MMRMGAGGAILLIVAGIIFFLLIRSASKSAEREANKEIQTLSSFSQNQGRAPRGISQRELAEFLPPIRFLDGSVDFNAVATALMQAAEQYDAPCAIRDGEIVAGAFSSNGTPCLVLYHPEHEFDYFNFCILRSQQGNTCVFEVYTCGSSRQIKKHDFQNNTRVFDGAASQGMALGVMRGGSVGAGYAIGSALGGIVRGGVKTVAKGINALTMDSEALAAEKAWYELVGFLFAQTLYAQS